VRNELVRSRYFEVDMHVELMISEVVDVKIWADSHIIDDEGINGVRVCTSQVMRTG